MAVGPVAIGKEAGKGTLALIVVATDASRHAIGRLTPGARRLDRVILGDRAQIGQALGKSGIALVGVTDSGLAESIGRAVTGGDEGLRN